MKNLIPKRVMEYIIITFAVVLMDVGIYVFKFPNNFSFGGVSGMAVVFSHFIPMTSAQINLVINLILLVIGFIVLGRDFGVKTAYVTVVSSLLLNVFEKVFPMDRALTGNIMLELCFAIILPALAAALLFFENASGGGTDIVAMIIKKYSTMNISGALFAVDCVIVVVSFMVFDLTTGLCSVLGLIAKTLLIDKSIERMKLNKYFTISNMNVVGSQYWNQVHGFTPEDVRRDGEGLQTMRALGENMAWLLKSIEAGRKAGVAAPVYEERIATNFIR